MTDQQPDPLKTTRQFRRLRTQFKADLGIEKLTRADRVLIDQCALLALRARQMRDDILTGAKPISDEDLVRATNACLRAMSALRGRGKRDKRDPVAESWEAAMFGNKDDEA
jgi:hypothetical protein